MAIGLSSSATSVEITGSSVVDTRGLTSLQTRVAYGTPKTGTSVTAGTPVKLRDTTGGKVFYMTSLSIGTTSAGGVILTDGSGGTIKFTASTSTAATNAHITFPVPLAFATGVWVDVSVNSSIYGSFAGYEE